ncbi:unnamed protein product [Amoebophrya sp. A25]|nr:unnamed protein product [Amoebophrya sp. A25]|eukprot:GSA25T00014266001.1
MAGFKQPDDRAVTVFAPFIDPSKSYPSSSIGPSLGTTSLMPGASGFAPLQLGRLVSAITLDPKAAPPPLTDKEEEQLELFDRLRSHGVNGQEATARVGVSLIWSERKKSYDAPAWQTPLLSGRLAQATNNATTARNEAGSGTTGGASAPARLIPGLSALHQANIFPAANSGAGILNSSTLQGGWSILATSSWDSNRSSTGSASNQDALDTSSTVFSSAASVAGGRTLSLHSAFFSDTNSTPSSSSTRGKDTQPEEVDQKHGNIDGENEKQEQHRDNNLAIGTSFMMSNTATENAKTKSAATDDVAIQLNIGLGIASSSSPDLHQEKTDDVLPVPREDPPLPSPNRMKDLWAPQLFSLGKSWSSPAKTPLASSFSVAAKQQGEANRDDGVAASATTAPVQVSELEDKLVLVSEKDTSAHEPSNRLAIKHAGGGSSAGPYSRNLLPQGIPSSSSNTISHQLTATGHPVTLHPTINSEAEMIKTLREKIAVVKAKADSDEDGIRVLEDMLLDVNDEEERIVNHTKDLIRKLNEEHRRAKRKEERKLVTQQDRLVMQFHSYEDADEVGTS